jgi:Tfp pilus assembly protein PilZ
MSESTAPRRGSIRLEVMQNVTGRNLNNGEDFSCAVMDLAVGGLSFRTESSLAVGDTLCLTLPALDDIPALTVECAVRWSRWIDGKSAHHVGCGFNFNYKIDEDRIARYVNMIHTNKLRGKNRLLSTPPCPDFRSDSCQSA